MYGGVWLENRFVVILLDCGEECVLRMRSKFVYMYLFGYGRVDCVVYAGTLSYQCVAGMLIHFRSGNLALRHDHF